MPLIIVPSSSVISILHSGFVIVELLDRCGGCCVGLLWLLWLLLLLLLLLVVVVVLFLVDNEMDDE